VNQVYLFYPIFSSVIILAHQYLSIVPFSYCAQGLLLIANVTLNILNRPIISSLLTLIRMFVVYGSH
jgi:Na+-driven multidrug efflux pump